MFVLLLSSVQILSFLVVSDRTLVGHVMKKVAVADEFECQMTRIGNQTCKSFNVHPGAENAKRVCKLNTNTRQMKPDDFKKKKGSNYYGSVKVSLKYFYKQDSL